MTISTALRRSAAVRTFLRAQLGRFDSADILTAIALLLIIVGLGYPLGFLVAGALILLVTPIGAALRFLIRGR